MTDITIYGTRHCPFCHDAENYLRSKGLADIRRNDDLVRLNRAGELAPLLRN